MLKILNDERSATSGKRFSNPVMRASIYLCCTLDLNCSFIVTKMLSTFLRLGPRFSMSYSSSEVWLYVSAFLFEKYEIVD